jgi:AcrR family transcriptional regulator
VSSNHRSSKRRKPRSEKLEPSRVEKKAQTRAKLVETALELVEEVGGLANVSIRELTKKVGVAPTAFYRHFESIDELGLELVDEVGISLRRIIREGRQADFSGGQMIRQSLEIYVEYIEKKREHFIFALQARTSGSKVIQSAIRSEFRFFTLELANDLAAMQLLPKVSSSDMEMIAELVVNTVAFGTVDLLDKNISPERREEVINKTEKQMRVIFLGAGNWGTRT